MESDQKKNTRNDQGNGRNHNKRNTNAFFQFLCRSCRINFCAEVCRCQAGINNNAAGHDGNLQRNILQAADPSGRIFSGFPLRINNGIRIERRCAGISDAVSELRDRHQNDNQHHIAVSGVRNEHHHCHGKEGDNCGCPCRELVGHKFRQVGTDDTENIRHQNIGGHQPLVLCYIGKVVDRRAHAHKIEHPLRQIRKQKH